MPPLPPPSDGPSQPPGSGPFAFPPPPEEAPGWATPRGFYPLDLDGVVRTAWSLFRFAWRTLIGIALIPLGIAYLIMTPISAAVSPAFSDWLQRYQNALAQGLRPPPFPNDQGIGVLLLIGAALGTVLAGVIASGAIIHASDAMFRGRPTTARGALAVAMRRSPSLIGQQLLLFLAMFGVLLLGIVFGSFFIAGGSAAAFIGIVVMVASFAAAIFIVMRWTFGAQAVVLEGAGAVEGLSRSWRLVAGSGWRVLGYVLVFGLISLGAALVLGVPQLLFNLDPTRPLDVALSTLLDGAAAAVLAPIAPLLATLLYYDLRFRAGEPAPQPGEDRAAAQPVEG